MFLDHDCPNCAKIGLNVSEHAWFACATTKLDFQFKRDVLLNDDSG